MVGDAAKMSRSEPCYQGIQEDGKAAAAVGYRERQSICGCAHEMCSSSQERAFLSWEKQARYQRKKEGRKEALQETAGDLE